ncbi:YhdT family protein [Vibrio salinus]|uniref:YhdT family protein n=1 Tax=Vibrio salinus TaxID=2899784 RepID=UPI001E565049|nr:YhdT family protein [Vibrio salinus]MCE0494905.1 YhdT family protein [Vibrio salinus]
MQIEKIYKQATREAIWAVALALGYFVWWYVTAYGFSPAPGDSSMPALYWGFPLWFLLSCIVGPVIFTILCALMVKVIYRDAPLEPQNDTDYE